MEVFIEISPNVKAKMLAFLYFIIKTKISAINAYLITNVKKWALLALPGLKFIIELIPYAKVIKFKHPVINPMLKLKDIFFPKIKYTKMPANTPIMIDSFKSL
jgi:hypothetical protein